MNVYKIFLTLAVSAILTMLYGVDDVRFLQQEQLEIVSSRDTIPGCTDPFADNYDPDATLNDGSCSYDEDFEENYTFLGRIENSSYYISTYYNDWWAANYSSAEYGGYLATLMTEEENIEVSEWAGLFGTPNWIGLYQDTESDDYSEPDGGWMWIINGCLFTGEPVAYTNWASGQPDASSDYAVTNFSCSGCWDDMDGNASQKWIMERDTDEIDNFIVLDTTALDFGECPIGGLNTQYVTISNVGTVDLEISDVQSSGADFTVSETYFLISPCDSSTLAVTFYPESLGEQSHVLSMSTNDPSHPIIEISVSGTGVEPPDIDVSPLSLHADLMTGDSTIQQITISNNGLSDLVWSISVGDTNTSSRDVGNFLEDFELLGEFEGNVYYMSNYSTTWTGADEIIQSWGGVGFHMATVTSAEENYFINMATNREVWIGFTDQDSEGEWVWVTGEPVGYTNWAGGEPNDAGGHEDWAHLWANGYWNDHNPNYETRFVIESGSPNWIYTDIDTGTISPGSTQNIYPVFNAKNMLYGGEYAADLVIASNDPDESEVVVSATMTVTPIPEISVDPLALDFHSYIGYTNTHLQHITVTNVGTGYLVVSDIQSSGSDFWVWPTDTISISPSSTQNFNVYFNPSSAGAQSHTLTINSNDSDTPTVVVSVSGTGMEPPLIEVDPTYLFTELSVGDSTTQTFTIENTGTGALEWSIFFGHEYSGGANTLENGAVEGSSPMYDLEDDNNYINYGNNGPYSSSRGAQDFDLNIGDIVFSAAIDTNNIDFYSLSPGGDWSLIVEGIEEVLAVYENGSIIFLDIQETYGNQNLFHLIRMDPDGTISYIAAFTSYGGDWDIDSWGNIVYITNNDLFLVSPHGHVQQVAWGEFSGADAVAVHPKTGDYYVADSDAQRIVRVTTESQVDHVYEDYEHLQWMEGLDFTPDGTLIIADEGTHAIYSFNGVSLTTIAQGGLIDHPEDVVVDQEGNYIVPINSYDGENDSTKSSIVKVTPDGDVTYLIEREFVYIDNLGIYRNMPTPWVSTDITSGTIAPGSQQTVEASFNASDIFGGSHHRTIAVTSNAVNSGTVNVSANADVTGIPNISTDNYDVVLDPVFVGSTSVEHITIFNNGTDVLEVFDVQSNSSDVTVDDTYFLLDPLEFNTFSVYFTLSSVGPQSATLTLISNDPDMQSLDISVSCIGIGFPDIAFNPDSLHEDLVVDTATVQTVMILNEGGSDLEWSIAGYAESHTFAKTDNADWTLSENQDRITENVWITRCGQYPLFNAYSQGCDQSDGPEGTEWAVGHIEDAEWLNFQPFKHALGQIGNEINYYLIPNDQPMVVYLIEEDIYFEVQFHSWTMGQNGGGFSYTRSGHPAEWIDTDSTYGTIAAGSYQDIQVQFNSGETYGGEYSTHIMFNTNIPDKSLVLLPVTLSVTGIPNIGVETLDLDFGEVFVGGTHTVGLWIGNSGTDDLIVSDVQSSGNDFMVSSTSFTVSPEDDYELEVSFSPTSLDEQYRTLTIMNNDPDEPVVEINIYGMGIPAPDIAVTPTFISAELLVGDSTVQSMTIANEGDDTLQWQIAADFALSFDGNSYLSIDNPTGIPSGNDTYTISAWVNAYSGGTRGIIGWGQWGSVNRCNAVRMNGNDGLYNYWWANDLYVSGINLIGGWHNVVATFDGVTREIYIDGVLKGYDFPTGHDAVISNFRIGSTNNGEYFHGLINEVSVWNIGLTQSQIQTIMNNGLNGNEDGLVGYWNFNEGTGDIVYDQSENENNGTIYGATWALPDSDGNLYITEWLQVHPPSDGVLEFGESIDLDFTFNAEDIYGGEYSVDFRVISNDPDESEVIVTANLVAVGIPEISIEQPAIEFGEIFIGVQDSLELVISSIGTDHLNVSDIQIDGDDFTVSETELSIAPETADTVRVYFSPSSTGSQEHTITVNSNDSESPTVDVIVSGTGIEPPDIAVSPDAISADILSSESTVQTLSISNEGPNDLEYSISVEGSSSSGSSSSVLPLALGNYWTYMEADEDDDEEYSIETDSIFLIQGYEGEHYYCYYVDADTSFDGYINYEEWAGWKGSTQDAVLGVFNGYDEGWNELFLELTMMKYDPYVGQSWTSEYFEGNINFTIVEQLDYSSSLGDFTDCWVVEMSFTDYAITVYWTWKIGLGPVQRDDDILVDYGSSVYWLTMDPSSGTVSPGNSDDINFTFNGDNMITGDYSAEINIHSNDPDESEVIVPAMFTVTGIPEIGMVYVDDPDHEGTEYYFGELYVGSTAKRDFLISNNGTGDLAISDIQADGGDWLLSSTSLTLSPGQHDTLTVSFTPSTVGEQSQALTITSNDPGSPLGLTLIGNGVDPPLIVVDIDDNTDTIQVEIPPGHSFVDEMMSLSNDGGTVLEIESYIRDQGTESSVMPLAIGSSWEYRYYYQDEEGNEWEDNEYRHIHDIVEYNGNHYFILWGDETDWFGYKSGLDAVYAQYDTDDGLRENKLLSDEPYVGETWTDTWSDDGLTFTVTENLDYTTQDLGTFKDCWKVERLDPEGSMSAWYWKIGIGFIAYQGPSVYGELIDFDFDSNTDWVDVGDYDIYPGESDDIRFHFSSDDSLESGIKMATLFLLSNDPENRLMRLPVKMTLDDTPHPTVLSIAPNPGFIDHRTKEMFINMSGPLDLPFFVQDDIFTYDFAQAGNDFVDADVRYIDSSNTIKITFQDGLSAADTFAFGLRGVESYYGYSLDGNGDGVGGDDYSSGAYYTSMLGDFDVDGTISVDDLSQFVIGLDNDDLDYELGPFNGEIPHVSLSTDSEYDIEDIVAFSMMWNWYYSDNTMTFNSYEDEGSPILIDVMHDSIYIDLQDDLSAYQIQIQYTPGSFFIGSVDNDGDLFFTHQDQVLGVYTIMAQSGESRLVIPIEIRGKNTDISISYKGLTNQGDLAGKMTKSMNIDNIPDEFVLYPNYPNPFNPITHIEYGLPEASQVKLVIYDILGREVTMLINGIQEPGYRSITWHGTDSFGKNVGAGMYFYLIQAGDFRQVNKMILLK